MQRNRLRLVVGIWLLSLMGWGQPVLAQSLSLPFFDDFSTSTTETGPTPSRWMPGSGVYINNTLTVNHPSVNIATFDGLRTSGQPYNLTNENAEGGTDTLMSRPINMGGLTAVDNVYISFYWQRRGLGEAPDATDSLVLDFLSSNGRWLQVWSAKGDTVSNNYTQQLVRIDNPALLHAAAQFRFRARGRQSGAFDQWHIDYVYLNKGRNAFDRYVADIAARQAVSPLLRRYTAMPLRQFLARPAAELADSVTTDVNNLLDNFNLLTFQFTIRDQITGNVVQRVPPDVSRFIQRLSRLSLSRHPVVTGAGLSGRAVLRTTFEASIATNVPDPIPGVDLRQNDTISGITVLDDYYAYDDGTAEQVKQINQRLARVAVRFVNNQPDAVRGVRIYIPPTRRNQEGQQIAFSVFNDAGNNTPAQRQLVQQTFPVKYATVRNGFVDYLFTTPVNVRDTFYVAFSQLDDPAIPVGFDRNSPYRGNTLLNLGVRWDAVPATDDDGALMIRPIMNNGPSNVITATEPEVAVTVYPNPSSGVVNWCGGTRCGGTRTRDRHCGCT